MPLYTLVHHSGLSQAVEVATVPNTRTAEKVRRLGGLIFDSYPKASDAEYAHNYPPGVEGMYPRCAGSFHPTLKFGRRALYLPPAEQKAEGNPT